LLFAAVTLALTPAALPGVWRNYNEVFDLAKVGPSVVAATNGGLIEETGGRWRSLLSPAGLREIGGLPPLTVQLSDTRAYSLRGRDWTQIPELPSRNRSLETGLLLSPTEGWPLREMPKPAATVYSLILDQQGVLAGTSAGLMRWNASAWIPVGPPSALPLPRPNGLAEIGKDYLIGGLGGLYLGRPGAWKQVSTQPVRQILGESDEAWVVYGSGAVDKVVPSQDQLFPDVWYGAARRPWVSCVAEIGKTLVFGGQGGWIEHGKEVTETYPKELDGDVVLAIEGREAVRWVGTQRSGLWRFGSGQTKRWNPGNGLTDPWVTSLCRVPPKGLMVGTMTGGLFLLDGDTIRPVECPTKRITSLAIWKGHLVVGAMDGAWLKEVASWRKLETDGEETTALTVLPSRVLAVTTASGVHFLAL